MNIPDNWFDTLCRAGDDLCNEAMQLTCSPPHRVTEQAERLERAVKQYRSVVMSLPRLQAAPAPEPGGDCEEE